MQDSTPAKDLEALWREMSCVTSFTFGVDKDYFSGNEASA